MKVVKVSRNWKQWDSGHRVALRFNSYSEAFLVEHVAAKFFPPAQGGGWRRDADYYSWFGKNNGRSDYRPYFISFRDEKMLTFVLLATGLTPK
jgi:hypothetical protein